MAYHIYHTRAVILGSVSTGESNRFYKIFTEELGLVGATAQSVREEKSKLRYALQDYSFITLDLVRGKEVWRIVSAGEAAPYPNVHADKARLKLFARMCSLLLRMMHGEGREDELFADLLGALDFLETTSVPENLELAFESLATFRALARLGYLDPESHERFLEPGVWSLELLEEFEATRIGLLSAINDALHASQL